MSENLDLVRSICADREHGDYGSTAWADREIGRVFVGGPTPGGWTGVRVTGYAELAEALRAVGLSE